MRPNAVISDDFIISNPRPVEGVPDGVSIPEFLYRKLSTFQGDRKLFIDQESGRTLTVTDLLTSARRLAGAILHRVPDLSRQAGDLAVFHAVNSLDLIIVELAIIFLGLPFSPVTINCKSYELQRQITNAGGTLLFCSANYADTVQEVLRQKDIQKTVKLAVVLDGPSGMDGLIPLSELDSEPAEPLAVDRIPYFPIEDPRRDIYMIIYTSGSTGLPKGAAHTHYAFLFGQIQMAGMVSAAGAGRQGDIVTYMFYPLAHSSGQMTTHAMLIGGVISVVNGHATPETILKAIHDYRIPTMSANPELGQFIVTHPELVARYDLTCLKVISGGGCHFPESIARKLMSLFGVAVLEGYGCTEVGWVSSRSPWDEYEPHNIGTPAPGVEIKIVDLTTGEALPPGRGLEGELWIKTPGCITGYIHRPEATAAAITPDGWYRSGDIGTANDRGQIILKDRIKEMIKYLGYAVYPAEVEHVLSQHPAVLDSIVVPVPDPVLNELPRAYVKLRPGYRPAVNETIVDTENLELTNSNQQEGTQEVSGSELQCWVADRLADQKTLRGGVVFLSGDMPRVLIGKPDRQWFKKLVKETISIQNKSDPDNNLNGKPPMAVKSLTRNQDCNGNSLQCN